jgi:hypothetical protein
MHARVGVLKATGSGSATKKCLDVKIFVISSINFRGKNIISEEKFKQKRKGKIRAFHLCVAFQMISCASLEKLKELLHVGHIRNEHTVLRTGFSLSRGSTVKGNINSLQTGHFTLTSHRGSCVDKGIMFGLISLGNFCFILTPSLYQAFTVSFFVFSRAFQLAEFLVQAV